MKLLHTIVCLLLGCAALLGQEPARAVLFMTGPATPTAQPTDPVLFARAKASEPGHFDFFDAAQQPLPPSQDPQSPGRSVLKLRPVPGKSFAKAGARFAVWTAAGKQALLDEPEIELGDRGGTHVLIDDDMHDVAIGAATVPAPTPPPMPTASGPDSLLQTFRMLRGESSDSTAIDKLKREGLQAMLDHPETIHRVVKSLLNGNHGLALLEDLQLDLKIIDTKDGEKTFGVGYAFERSFAPKDWEFADDGSVHGFDYALSAAGNVAFERDANPQDFLTGRLTASYFESHGGIAAMSDAERRQFATDFNALGDQLVKTKNARTSEVGRAIVRKYQSVCTTQYYWEGGLDAGIESNQAFTERNYTIGAHLGGNIFDGRDTSAWSHFNIVDYPAALLRVLTGYDQAFTPHGNALPWVIAGIDHVTPDGNDPRALVGDTTDYFRARVEVAYRAPIGTFDGIDYYLGASWRAYQELGASRAVRDADADQQSRFVVTLRSATGLFASYASGRLPFDVTDRDSFELGWTLNF